MPVRTILGKLRGGGQTDDETEAEEPSHVCDTCGETYFTDRDIDISTCRECGGVRVERA